MNAIRALLDQIIEINDVEWAYISRLLRERKIKAKTELVSAGKISSEMFVVQSGLLRVYHLLDGKEVTTYFACDNQFISTYASFVTRTPSFEVLEAVEDSVVYSITHDALNELYRFDAKFEKLGKYIAEQNYLCIHERTLLMQTKSAKEKYLHFIESTDAKIRKNVPQHFIASFLGITPETLSRIRKELINS